MPALATPLPPAGSGLARVIISTDVPAQVERATRDAAESLCAVTPCTVLLPYGDHELSFTGLEDTARQSSAVVHATRDTVVLNHTLGQRRQSAGEQAGLTLVSIGVVVMAVALGITRHDSSESRDDSAAVDVGMAGLSGIVLGGLVAATSPSKLQDGSTTQWSPEPDDKSAAKSVERSF